MLFEAVKTTQNRKASMKTELNMASTGSNRLSTGSNRSSTRSNRSSTGSNRLSKENNRLSSGSNRLSSALKPDTIAVHKEQSLQTIAYPATVIRKSNSL